MSEHGYRPDQETACQVVPTLPIPWEIPDNIWEGVGFEVRLREALFQHDMTDLSIDWDNFVELHPDIDWDCYYIDGYRKYFIDQAKWLEAASLTAVLHSRDWSHEEVTITDIARYVWNYTQEAMWELENLGGIPTEEEAQEILGEHAFHACGATIWSIGWAERAHRVIQSGDNRRRKKYLIIELFQAIEGEWDHRLGRRIERKYGEELRESNLKWWFLGYTPHNQKQRELIEKIGRAIEGEDVDREILTRLFQSDDFHRLRRLRNRILHDNVPPTQQYAKWAYQTFIGSENAWIKQFLGALPK